MSVLVLNEDLGPLNCFTQEYNHDEHRLTHMLRNFNAANLAVNFWATKWCCKNNSRTGFYINISQMTHQHAVHFISVNSVTQLFMCLHSSNCMIVRRLSLPHPYSPKSHEERDCLVFILSVVCNFEINEIIFEETQSVNCRCWTAGKTSVQLTKWPVQIIQLYKT